ncbi:MAG: HIT family protein [Solirubrobacterales bacterium]
MAPDPDCIFCSIVAGDVAAEIVHGDDTTVAFLDHRPLFPGHVLLVPREHHETIEDLPAPLVEPLFATARTLAGAVRRAMGSQGTFVALNNKVSQSVPHLHVHIVPRNRKDGLRGFFWPRNPYEDEAHLAAVADAIRAELAQASP